MLYICQVASYGMVWYFLNFFTIIKRVPKSKKGTYDATPSRIKNSRPIVFQHNTVCASSDIGPKSICILAKLGTPWL